VNGLWEGPRNVLLTQVYRDTGKVADWYPAREMVWDMPEGGDSAAREALAAEAEDPLSRSSLFAPDAKTLEVCKSWDSFRHRLFHAFQDAALSRVEG
jgi:hypothetical protein